MNKSPISLCFIYLAASDVSILAALADFAGDATDPGDVRVSSGRILHGFAYVAKEVGVNAQLLEQPSDTCAIALDAEEQRGIARLLKRCTVANVADPLSHIFTASSELEATIIASLPSMSLGLQENTLKSQVSVKSPYVPSNELARCLIYVTFLQLNKEFSAIQKLGRNLCSQTGTAAVQLKVERRILYKTSDHVTNELIVDLAFPGTARTIHRIMDAYWQAKVSFCPSWLIFHKSNCWTPNSRAAFLGTKSEFRTLLQGGRPSKAEARAAKETPNARTMPITWGVGVLLLLFHQAASPV